MEVKRLKKRVNQMDVDHKNKEKSLEARLKSYRDNFDDARKKATASRPSSAKIAKIRVPRPLDHHTLRTAQLVEQFATHHKTAPLIGGRTSMKQLPITDTSMLSISLPPDSTTCIIVNPFMGPCQAWYCQTLLADAPIWAAPQVGSVVSGLEDLYYQGNPGTLRFGPMGGNQYTDWKAIIPVPGGFTNGGANSGTAGDIVPSLDQTNTLQFNTVTINGQFGSQGSMMAITNGRWKAEVDVPFDGIIQAWSIGSDTVPQAFGPDVEIDSASETLFMGTTRKWKKNFMFSSVNSNIMSAGGVPSLDNPVICRGGSSTAHQVFTGHTVNHVTDDPFPMGGTSFWQPPYISPDGAGDGSFLTTTSRALMPQGGQSRVVDVLTNFPLQSYACSLVQVPANTTGGNMVLSGISSLATVPFMCGNTPNRLWPATQDCNNEHGNTVINALINLSNTVPDSRCLIAGSVLAAGAQQLLVFKNPSPTAAATLSFKGIQNRAVLLTSNNPLYQVAQQGPPLSNQVPLSVGGVSGKGSTNVTALKDFAQRAMSYLPSVGIAVKDAALAAKAFVSTDPVMSQRKTGFTNSTFPEKTMGRMLDASQKVAPSFVDGIVNNLKTPIVDGAKAFLSQGAQQVGRMAMSQLTHQVQSLANPAEDIEDLGEIAEFL